MRLLFFLGEITGQSTIKCWICKKVIICGGHQWLGSAVNKWRRHLVQDHAHAARMVRWHCNCCAFRCENQPKGKDLHEHCNQWHPGYSMVQRAGVRFSEYCWITELLDWILGAGKRYKIDTNAADFPQKGIDKFKDERVKVEVLQCSFPL
jgi:hypothetical protein